MLYGFFSLYFLVVVSHAWLIFTQMKRQKEIYLLLRVNKYMALELLEELRLIRFLVMVSIIFIVFATAVGFALLAWEDSFF